MIIKRMSELQAGDVLATGILTSLSDPVRPGEVVTQVDVRGGWVHVWTDRHPWGIGPQFNSSHVSIREAA